MNEVIDSLNISSQVKPTNQDIIVEYTPNSNVVSYNYTLYKDNEIIETYNNTLEGTTINLIETGSYKIIINETLNTGYINTITSGIYNVDKEKPKINLSGYTLTMRKGDKLDLFSDVSAIDNFDGNLKDKITTNYDELDFNELGLKKLVYTVTDEAGNVATKTVEINVISPFMDGLVYMQMAIVVLLVAVIILLLTIKRSLELERRISKFSIKPVKDNSLSLFDNFMNSYQKLVFKISESLEKSVFIKRYSAHFDKYLPLTTTYEKGLDFVSSKLIIGFIFVFIASFSKALKYTVLSLHEFIIPFSFGFFILDIVYFIKYKFYRSKMENDLLQAIIIMNNAFKSGRSIVQAVELVTTELDGPIAKEFEKMNMELKFGLEIDIVFERFAKRVNIEEVTYLTASLSILNKTGGNIIKVFTSIEKSLFNKKKLNLELNALIGSSKIIVYVLFLVPILFVLLISLINPGYFNAFFTNPLGIILFIFMLIYYILYIVIVSKVMKVRM